MQVGDTFATYAEFSAALTAEIARQKAVFRVYAAETVQNYLKKHASRKDIPDGIRWV